MHSPGHNNNLKTHPIIAVISAAIIICTLLVINFFPGIPRTIGGWGVLVIFGLPSLVMLEWLGEIVLGSRFIKNQSSGIRILFGVLAILLLLPIVYFVLIFVQSAVMFAGG